MLIETTPTAVLLEPAFDDPDAVLAAIRGGAEFWPIARYAASEEELAATGGAGATTYVPPWFRCDFALEGRALEAGAEQILHNQRFVDAAQQVYGPQASVSPTTVYVNVMLPSAVPFVPHLDVPAFRGFTRRDHPVWLLKTMLESGLFERWRVKLATAVSWFYEGPGGTFHYWPGGPDEPAETVEPPFRNVAVVADNERTFHGVAPVGDGDLPWVEGLTRASSLVRVDGGWEMRDGGDVIGAGRDDEVRITVSWKGEVALPHDGADDDLTVRTVVDTFLRDVRRRGIDVSEPEDPHRDPDWIATLGTAYPTRSPRIPR